MKSHWGFNKIFDEEYFLEEGFPVDELCPFKPPKFSCPHRTLSQKPITPLPAGVYVLPSGNQFQIPPEIIVTNIWFPYLGMSTYKKILPEFEVTNYVPIVIQNFKFDRYSFRFLECLQSGVNKIGRSVVLEHNEGYEFPVPEFVRRL